MRHSWRLFVALCLFDIFSFIFFVARVSVAFALTKKLGVPNKIIDKIVNVKNSINYYKLL